MTKSKFPFGNVKSPNGKNQWRKVVLHDFSARLRQCAEARKLNQTQLAKLVGLPSSSMNRYWNGDRMPPADLLFLLADTLAANPKWLIFGEDAPLLRSTIEADDAELLSAFKELSSPNQEHVLATIRLLGQAPDVTSVGGETSSAGSTLHGTRLPYRSR
jgi:transcriptional regulator with XRE-family HTH domain